MPAYPKQTKRGRLPLNIIKKRSIVTLVDPEAVEPQIAADRKRRDQAKATLAAAAEEEIAATRTGLAMIGSDVAPERSRRGYQAVR